MLPRTTCTISTTSEKTTEWLDSFQHSTTSIPVLWNYQFFPSLQHIIPQTKPRTGNAEYYNAVSKTLHEHIQRKQLEISDTFIFHQDNTRPHMAFQMLAFLQKWNIELLAYPSQSPNVALWDVWLFPILKRHLRSQMFDTDAQAVHACEEMFKRVSEGIFKSTIASTCIGRWKRVAFLKKINM